MWCENEIEYILEHLQDPERLMDGEFVEWLEKKEHFRLESRESLLLRSLGSGFTLEKRVLRKSWRS